MPTARLQYRFALVSALCLPLFLVLPSSPLEAQPPVVALDASISAELEAVAPAPKEPLVLPGVVLEEVSKNSALEKAGLQVGDVILSWERLPNPPANPEGASGKIEGPFDWMWLEIEQAPRGALRLTGERDGTPFSYAIGLGQWGAQVTPNFTSLSANLFSSGRLLEMGGGGGSEIKEWLLLASWLGQCANASKEEAWLMVRVGKMLADRGSRTEAESYYLRALEKAPTDLSRSIVLDLIAIFFFEAGNYSESERYFRSALDLRKSRSLGELSIAKNMNSIAATLYYQGRISELDGYLHSALEVYRNLAPQAPGLIGIIKNLGINARQLGRLDQSIKYHQESLAIVEVVSPGSIAHADILQELGIVERDFGRMREARDHLSQALEMFDRLAPGSADLANTLNALSLLYRSQGELDQALVLARRSLSVSEGMARADNGRMAAALNSIALIENALGQWQAAEADLARALELAPGSDQEKRLIPAILANMAVVQENQGNFSAALPLYRQALELKRRSGLAAEIAPTLRSVGILHHRMGKPEEARAYLIESLSIQQNLQPGSVETADTLDVLASVLAESGNLAEAIQYFEKALKIVEEVAPSSLVAANIYSNYGVVQQRLGFLFVAREYLRRAVDVYDNLFLRSSYSHAALSSLSARQYSAYINAAGVYIGLADYQSALEVVEKGRGRSLIVQLAERDLLPLAEVSEETSVRVRDLERLLHRAEIGAADTSNDLPADRLVKQAEHRALFRERDRLMAEIRRSSPRLAALRYPKPLSAKEIQEILEKGTLLVYFIVGGKESYSFILGHDEELRIQAVPIGESELRQRVDRFRGLIDAARPGTRLGESRLAELRRLSQELYKLLFAPAADRLEKAERVLIVADGPLRYLPFAALSREVIGEGGRLRDQYLGEWKPFHSVLSATVYAEIKKDRQDLTTKAQASGPLSLGAFGDPQFPPGLKGKSPEQIADIRVRSSVRRGTLQFEPLPFSRREVEGIAALFPPKQVVTYLGAEATEERAKAIGKGSRILHFATHARLDDRFPLNSALVLTMPEGFPEDRDNGLLQVWEIFERVRLDADLVVLSACDTGLGEEQGGEGLIGLTRAFQYAGARTVMASLWSVQDRATSELMIRFYKHLRAGLPKDEALRQAQMELIRGPIEVLNEKGEKTLLDASAPYYWAGFQLYGDWQ